MYVDLCADLEVKLVRTCVGPTEFNKFFGQCCADQIGDYVFHLSFSRCQLSAM